jgi:hypothetical protein
LIAAQFPKSQDLSPAIKPMSYIIHIWETPVPSTVEEAEALHQQLASQKAPQNPKFITLASKLTACFPGDTAMNDDDDDAVWTDGAIDGLTGQPVYGIGVRTDALERVLPVLLRLARDSQLVVYDMQAARLYRPDGRIMGLTGEARVVASEEKGAHEELQGRAHVLTLLKQALEPVMAPHGFKPNKIGFGKKFRELEQRIEFDIGDYVTKEVRMYIAFELNLSGPLKEIAENFTSGACELALPVLLEGEDLPHFTAHHVGVEFQARFVGELRNLGHKLARVFSNVIFPKLTDFESIAGLNRGFGDYDAGSDPALTSLLYGDILVAYLCGYPGLLGLIDLRITQTQDEHRVRKLNGLKEALASLAGT